MKTRAVACALGMTAGLVASAANLTITSDVTNWEGLTLPGAGEEIIINAGVTATVTTRAALAAIRDCSRIRPMSETSRFEVVVPAGETWTNECPMSAVNLAGAGNKDFAKGEIYKRGEGTLFLVANRKLTTGTKVGSLTIYDWWTGLTAAEGTLRLPEVDTNGTHYVGYVTASNNAVFGVVGDNSTYVRGLFGQGVVQNFSSTKRRLLLMNESVNKVTDFSGDIGGNLEFSRLKNGTAYLRGTNSTFPGNATFADGTTWIEKFGMSGQPSTVGAGTTVYFNNGANVRIGYLGSGETTTRELYVYQDAAYRAVLDGGAFGGLDLAGTLRLHTGVDKMREFAFAGSNANACVVSGKVYGNYSSGGNVFGGLYFAKEGSGTWRFADHYERKFATGFGIREGVLEYDSLDERGRLSALGLATNLTASGGSIAQLPQVDYAFTLGSPTPSPVPAVLSYSGTNGVSCTTRPIALVGKGGHLRNDTERRLRFRSVSSLAGSDVKTLTLDGSGANTNEMADVTNGAGTTGVTKEGTGTWCLSGDLTFTGPLDVKEGTLIVRKTQPGAYKWFRWTIQDKHVRPSDSSYNAQINLAQIGLFNADGAYQTVNLKLNDHYSELKPGEFGFQTVRTRVDLPSNVTKPVESMTHPESMFTGKSGSYGMWAQFYTPQSQGDVVQRLNQPDTWLSVVMRLADAADEIAFFDYMNVWYEQNSMYSVKTSSLEGSVDGLHWNMLTNGLEVATYTVSWTWGVAGRAQQTKEVHTDGAPVVGSTTKTYSVLTGEPVVSVATNAALIAEGEMSIKHLSVNAAEGLGEINGFAFAEGGTIEFTNLARETTNVKANIKNAKDLVNVNNWAVSVDGKAKPGYTVTVSPDGIKINRSGLMLIVR